MVYTSNDWLPGDLITAAKMNNLEGQYTETINYINASTGITPISVSASSNIVAGGYVSGMNLSTYISDPSTNTVNAKMYMYYGGSISYRLGFKKTYAHPTKMITYGFYLSRDSTGSPTGPIYAKIIYQPTSAVLKTSTYIVLSSNLSTVATLYDVTMVKDINAGTYYFTFEIGTSTEGAWTNVNRVNAHYYSGVPVSSESIATWTTTGGLGLSTAGDMCGTRLYGIGINTI